MAIRLDVSKEVRIQQASCLHPKGFLRTSASKVVRGVTEEGAVEQWIVRYACPDCGKTTSEETSMTVSEMDRLFTQTPESDSKPSQVDGWLKRIKQSGCMHKKATSVSCINKGYNAKEGHWWTTYSCKGCGFTYGEWLEADEAGPKGRLDKEVLRVGYPKKDAHE